jgi:hypothetical protein
VAGEDGMVIGDVTDYERKFDAVKHPFLTFLCPFFSCYIEEICSWQSSTCWSRLRRE